MAIHRFSLVIQLSGISVIFQASISNRLFFRQGRHVVGYFHDFLTVRPVSYTHLDVYKRQVPSTIYMERPLGKNEYVVRVEGKSMEPLIPVSYTHLRQFLVNIPGHIQIRSQHNAITVAETYLAVGYLVAFRKHFVPFLR